MNVNKKIVLTAVGGVLLVVLVFAAVMLFRGIRQFSVAEANLSSARKTLESFYRKQPFPSADNVKIVNRDVSAKQGWIRDVTDFIKRKQVDPDATKSPSVFINMLGETKNRLWKKGKQSGVVFSGDEDFAFGFGRYVQGEPATADYVPRLIQQLMIVDEICSILLDEKVKEIMTVGREEFEGAKNDSARRQPAGRGSRREEGRAANAGLARVSTLPPASADVMAGEFVDDSLSAKLKFTFEFMAKESSLLNILNRLARSEMFVVVTSVEVEAPDRGTAFVLKADDGSRPDEARQPAGAFAFSFNNPGGAEANDQKKELKPSARRPLLRQERVVFGGKVEQPARIRLDVEVYRFK